MFDLTKNIKLDVEHQKTYRNARILLHVFFVIGAFTIAFKILFPSQSLNLYFENINAAKNTIVNPQLNDGKIPSKGMIENNKLIFDANPFGNFSSVKATVIADKKYDIAKPKLEVRKSYQAFFYPEGKPMGFKSGSLLTTNSGDYYIVSGGLLRKFENTDIILNFGFPKSAFRLVSESDLAFNEQGPNISSSATYPEDSLFNIDEKFYQLKNGNLLPFLSVRAFLSQYQAEQAVSKSIEIFSTYPASENAIGFADGTIASSAGSAFILSQGKSYPIADFNTFSAMGFSWDKVVALESDELGSHEQQKQFTLNQPHPNGTIFLDTKQNKYYIIDKNEKRPLPNENIVKTYPAENAIKVDGEGLEKKLNYEMEKNLFRSSRWSCQIPLNEVASIIGTNYQFQADFPEKIKLKEINLTFSTPMTWQNMLLSLSKIKGNLQNNYSAQ